MTRPIRPVSTEPQRAVARLQRQQYGAVTTPPLYAVRANAMPVKSGPISDTSFGLAVGAATECPPGVNVGSIVIDPSGSKLWARVSAEVRTSEVQSISGTMNGGVGHLTEGQLTNGAWVSGYIANNASSAAVQAAIEAAAGAATGTYACTGGPLPAAITISYGLALAGRDVPQITQAPGTTGLASSTTTPGSRVILSLGVWKSTTLT